MGDFQQQKADLFRSMDKDSQDFVKRFAGKFSIQGLEYTRKGEGFKVDNKTESIIKVNSED